MGMRPLFLFRGLRKAKLTEGFSTLVKASTTKSNYHLKKKISLLSILSNSTKRFSIGSNGCSVIGQDSDKTSIQISCKEYSPDVVSIILLHGLTYGKQTWDKCAKIIANKTGSKVYYFDARNHGDSDWSKVFSFEAMVEDLLKFMDSRNIPKATIVGHSMGGRTAMYFAFKYPERINGFISEDMSLLNHPEVIAAGIKYLKLLRAVPDQLPSWMDLNEAKRFLADQFRDKKNNEVSLEEILDLPLVKINNRFELKINLDVILEYMIDGSWLPNSNEGKYDGPVLVIYGTKSPINVLHSAVSFLKCFSKAVYKPVEGAKHLIHNSEFQDIFCQLVADFVIKLRNYSD